MVRSEQLSSSVKMEELLLVLVRVWLQYGHDSADMKSEAGINSTPEKKNNIEECYFS